MSSDEEAGIALGAGQRPRAALNTAPPRLAASGQIQRDPAQRTVILSGKRVVVLSRAELAVCPHWGRAFAGQRKDRRYYALLEDTIRQEFSYLYFAVLDEFGEVQAIQPFFILDQDLLAGVDPRVSGLVEIARQIWPRFAKMKTLMVGCVAGEGHLDGDPRSHDANAQLLAAAIVAHARDLKTPLIVLKEFPAKYRKALACFVKHGFRRMPSLPMTRLNVDYSSFEEYMRKALNSATRTKLRRKFRATAHTIPIALDVVEDISSFIDAAYPLYLQVYDRSRFHFEKLTREYFCEIGQAMPERVRFFLWRQDGRLIAFALCMLHDDAIYAEYVGFDYAVALKLHLYHYAVRDMIAWAMSEGYKWFRSSGLNYDPKLHFRHELDPVDLYVRHTSRLANAVLKQILPLIGPVRYDETLKRFPNYRELWGDV